MSPSSSDVRETYEVLAKLGEGGMGSIYQVRHRHLNQLRVMKIMKPQLEGGNFEKRFLREAQLEAQLQHPNIAQLHEFEITPSGAAYMVMEYIEGVTLKEALDARGPFTVGLALEAGRQALEALAYLHDRGFVHRDISPDNLMFCRDSRGRPVVKVIDLGIAKKSQEGEAEQRITKTGTFLGKVHYASPEQFRGSGVDWRTDIYSFGIVLYELLTGQFPIRGGDTNSLIASHLFEEPIPFEETDPTGRVPEALRRLVLRALAKDPDERFGSTTEFAEALTALQGEDDFEAAEIDNILAVRREPDRLPPTSALSILGTTPSVTPFSPTARLPSESDPTVAMGPAPEAPWTTRVFGAPGVPRLRRIALTGAILVGLAVGLATIPWPNRGATPTEEAPDPAALRRADAMLLAGLDLGTAHALVVGNDAYVDPELPRLESAIGDARAVASLLENRYGFEVTTLFDATRTDLYEALDRLRASVGPRDSVLLYYAGHGAVLEERPYWQLVDSVAANTAQWVAITDVNDELRALPARRVLVVADSCYAGGGPDQPLPPPEPPARAGAPWRQFVETSFAHRARLALSSGRFEEVPDRALGSTHSPFAQALLELLDANDRLIDVGSLYRDLQDRVKAEASLLGSEQHPVLTPLPTAGDDGGSFFFAPTGLSE